MRLSKEIKAAFFVLSTIMLFIFGFNYLKGSSLLDRQKTIYAVYDEVDGLLVGANVMINGLSIGNVTELDFLTNSTKILVTLKVKDKLNFSSKSTASIYETGVLGGLAISIEPLFDREFIVKSGDTLKSSVRPGLTELINRQIEPLSRQLQSTITSVDSIFTGASNVLNRQTQEEIKESISVLTSAINAINKSSIIIEETLTAKNNQIKNTIDNFENISSNLSDVSNELNSAGLSNLITSLEVSVEGINSIVSKLESDNSTIGKLLNEDDIYNNLNLSLQNLSLLIDDIKSNPKKYVHFSVFGRK
ncbi:MAG: ABC transporter substrate-binding protein [Flavobacteriaceae bacterium]|nr:ABC transporter substrate-binding protein [Flavobacteriaceae bacterium]